MTSQTQTLSPQDALHELTLRRFRHWAGVANATEGKTQDSNISDLLSLVSVLLEKQAQGQGIVSIAHDLASQENTLDKLHRQFPHLISDSSADSPTPIVIFSPYIAFRRDYQQLAEAAHFLQRSEQLKTPSHQAHQQVTWQLGIDENGKEKYVSNEQHLAALSAATLPFCTITGGAGTGKTTTLAKALELILLDHPEANILLAAPTGKAAQRLNESLAKQADSIHHSVREKLLSLKAKTLHQLLGISAQSGLPFYHRQNPLRCDVLAVDEASMVSSHLFSLIQHAILSHTQLILLGDANQLPPINSTAFFNDVSRLPMTYSTDFCQALNPYLTSPLTPTPDSEKQPLNNAICRLTISQRFGQKSLIEQAGEAILASNTHELLHLIKPHFHSLSALSSHFLSAILANYPDDADALEETLSQRIILCANRRGAFGSQAINAHLDKVFRQRLSPKNSHGTWYEGRRILIEQNDYQLNMTNGDIGVCRQINQQWWIVFDEQRRIPIDDLIEEKYSLAFAISIHKSQGSEYPSVDIILDTFTPENPNPLVTSALLYTAITRAKSAFSIYADEALIKYALEQPSNDLSPLQFVL